MREPRRPPPRRPSPHRPPPRPTPRPQRRPTPRRRPNPRPPQRRRPPCRPRRRPASRPPQLHLLPSPFSTPRLRRRRRRPLARRRPFARIPAPWRLCVVFSNLSRTLYASSAVERTLLVSCGTGPGRRPCRGAPFELFCGTRASEPACPFHRRSALPRGRGCPNPSTRAVSKLPTRAPISCASVAGSPPSDPSKPAPSPPRRHTLQRSTKAPTAGVRQCGGASRGRCRRIRRLGGCRGGGLKCS
mmetsp:Transcript_27570/g.92604  ORF Transcript_27570/g.92604 Transcript_27570/m.92604 type:complete len:244 (-) Transcript_27570:618-1349(-)